MVPVMTSDHLSAHRADALGLDHGFLLGSEGVVGSALLSGHSFGVCSMGRVCVARSFGIFFFLNVFRKVILRRCVWEEVIADQSLGLVVVRLVCC